jgi:hypothetical protein
VAKDLILRLVLGLRMRDEEADDRLHRSCRRAAFSRIGGWGGAVKIFGWPVNGRDCLEVGRGEMKSLKKMIER